MSDDSSNSALGCLFMIAFLAFGAAQLWAGYLGIQHHLGNGWAGGAIVALFFGITFPISIGSFFGARDVWEWHWLGALAFAAPGLVLQFLIWSGSLLSSLRGR